MAGLIAVLNACNGSEKDATSSENPFFIEFQQNLIDFVQPTPLIPY